MAAGSSYELAALVSPSHRPSLDSSAQPRSHGQLSRRSTVSENLLQLLRRRADRDANAASALDNYLHLSQKKADPRFADLVWFTTSSVTSLLDVKPPLTYLRYFDQLHRALLEQAEVPFQLCAVAETCDNPREPFSFSHNLGALVQGRYDDLEQAIQVLVIWMLCLDGNVDENELLKLLSVLRTSTEKATSDFRLPSEIQPEPIDDIFAATGDLIAFRWARNAPLFAGDVNMQIWQPQNSLPPVEHVTLIIKPRQVASSYSAMRTFLVAKSPRTLRRVRDSFVDALKNQTQPHQRLDTSTSTMIFLISLLCSIRADLKRFMTCTKEQIQLLTVLGRRSPSAAKIQYLCHLEDYQVTVARCCADLAHTTERFTKCCSVHVSHGSTESTVAAAAVESLKELQTDFLFLSGEISSHGSAVKPIKGMVDEQLGLKSRARTLVIQILVALYVPLSFVTSFLGMNIDSTAVPTNTNYTAAYVGASKQQETTPNSNGTQFFDGLHVNQTSDAKQPLTWPLQTFFIAGVPLTIVTILVPLIAGATFRAISRSIQRYRHWWRLVVMCLYPPTLYILVCMKMTFLNEYTIALSFALDYVPFFTFCIWRLEHCRRHAKQLRGARMSWLRRWLPFFGWIVFLLACLYFPGTQGWVGNVDWSGEESFRIREQYIDMDTGWFLEGRETEGMGWALRNPDLVGTAPWIAIAMLYLVRGALKWCQEYWRRRAEKANQERRGV